MVQKRPQERYVFFFFVFFYFEVKCGKRKRGERETYSRVCGSGRTEGLGWECYIKGEWALK